MYIYDEREAEIFVFVCLCVCVCAEHLYEHLYVDLEAEAFEVTTSEGLHTCLPIIEPQQILLRDQSVVRVVVYVPVFKQVVAHVDDERRRATVDPLRK